MQVVLNVLWQSRKLRRMKCLVGALSRSFRKTFYCLQLRGQSHSQESQTRAVTVLMHKVLGDSVRYGNRG